jgi:hypothetical protein
MAKRSNRSSSSENNGFDTDTPVAPLGQFDAAPIGADRAPGNAVPKNGAAPTQSVFIEGNVPDAGELAHGVTPGVRVVLLDPSLDGVRQIANYLTSHDIQNLAAIDIVSHGADGLLDLGSTELNAATIGQYQGELAAIGAALQPGGAIQLYGCDVAQDAAGDAFLQQLSQATGGANIAAASHLVGAADEGGSWTLNVDVGTDTAGDPFTAATQAGFPDVLAAATGAGLTSATSTSTADVSVAPTVTAGGTPTFDGGGLAVTLDPGLTISDASSTTLTSATVVDSGFILGDTLTVGSLGGLGSVFSNGTLTLSGTASLSVYQTALDSVKFDFTGDGDPTGGGSHTSRTIDWSVSDGILNSGTVTSAVEVMHTAPSITTSGVATFDGGGGAVVLDSGVAISDVNSGGVLSGATITVAGAITGDTLNFRNTNSTIEGNISVASDSGGVLKLTSLGTTATLAEWQTALASVTYSFTPSNGDPTNGGGDTSRTIDWAVSDGSTSNGTSGTSTSTLETVHTAPTLTAGATATFIGGGGAVVLDQGVAVRDVDSSGVLSSATITVAGAITGDTLNFSNIDIATEGNISVASDSDGVLKLTSSGSTATLLQWQTALASVTYSFSPPNGDPTNGGGDTSRTIDWLVNDGVLNSGTVTSTLDVVHIAPTVTASGTVSYSHLGSAAVLDSTLTASAPDSGGDLTGATIKISSGFTTGDMLNFSTQNGITESGFNNGTLSLTGTASITNYEAALQSITYSSSLTDPTVGGTDDSRTISWSVNDGVTNSAASTSTVDVFACFVTGTMIATRDGPRSVEALRIGDLILTRSGESRPIRWIGHRHLDLTRHPAPERVAPIRIRRHAFADNVPHRDLLLSPDHAVLRSGALVPVRLLLNGATIVREPPRRDVLYYHIELDAHDILLAENLPAESYLDTGNRGVFENVDDALILHPDLTNGQARREAGSCAEFVDKPARVEPMWRELAARAERLGWRLPKSPETTDDPALRIRVKEKLIRPASSSADRYVFALPGGTRNARLLSRSMVPGEQCPWVEDRRRLRVMVSRLTIRIGEELATIPLDHPALRIGWWDVEQEGARMCRWTNGDAALPLFDGWPADDRPAIVEICLSATLAYAEGLARFEDGGDWHRAARA